MSQIILFQCRSCERELAISPSKTEAAPPATIDNIECPGCRRPAPVRMGGAIAGGSTVQKCVACGHDTLYVQKDFNRNTGVGIVALGVLVSIVFLARREALYAMLALFAAALVDLVIYTLTKDVTVCYSCHAVYRGFEKNPAHGPFDLKDLEKYGGREPRF